MRNTILLFTVTVFVLFQSIESLRAQEMGKDKLTDAAISEMRERIRGRYDSLLKSIRIRKLKGYPRPKIGYALSGGGAKGIAHIGAIQVLEKAGLFPDMITGTSMGSIVGSMYAVGYNAEQMAAVADSMNWDNYLYDKMSRRDFSLEEKNEAEAYLLNFALKKWKLQMPKGLVGGQKLGMMLGRLLWPSHDIDDFGELRVKFAALATDVVTGERVLLDKGYLPDVVRASMAIPTAFTPMEIDGRLLVDGGIVQNFPVEEVKEMGADIVVGVDVGAILYERKDLNSALAILDQLTSLSIVVSTLKQERNCDIYIRPQLGDLSAGSFDQADSLAHLGRIAATEELGIIEALSDSLQKYYPLDQVPDFVPKLKRVFVEEIEFQGLSRVSKSLVQKKFGIKTGEFTTINKIEKGIDVLFGTQFFQKVDYKIEGNGKGVRLILRCEEDEKVALKFGLNYDNVLKAGVVLNYTIRNWKTIGSRMMMRARLSENPALNLSYRFFLARKINMMANAEIDFQNYDFPEYRKTESGVVRDYQSFSDLELKFDFESVISNDTKVGFGPHLKLRDAALYSGDLLQVSGARVGAHLFWKLDTYDRAFFPKTGRHTTLNVAYNHVFANSGAEREESDVWSFMFRTDRVFNLAQRWYLRANANFGFQDVASTLSRDQFSLGSRSIFEDEIFQFAGVHYRDINAPNLMTSQLTFLYEPWADRFVYAKGNLASFSDDFLDTVEFKHTIIGVGVGVGVQSIIGPVFVEAARSSEYSDWVWRVNVGFVF